MTGLRLVHRRASLLSLAAALIPFTLVACAKKQPRPPRQAATVAVVPVRRATVPYILEANGVVTPLQSVAISAQVDGIITSVDFQEGQEVRAGQALFHVDPRPYRNAYLQAVAVLARDSANFVNAQSNADRYKQLLAAKVVTPQEGEQQFATAAANEATVDADRAAVAQAKFNLDNTIVRAPISGKTGSLLVKQGNLARANSQTPLVVINQVRPILVRFAIPSAQLALLMQHGAQNGGLPVTAVPGGVAPPSPSIDSLAAEVSGPVQDNQGTSGSMQPGGASTSAGSVTQQGGVVGDPVNGTLTFIDNAVDTATGTVQLKAKFDNSAGTLWAGQFAATSLHLFDEDSVLVVPSDAVVTGQRGAYVYVVDQADTARQRAVTVERVAGALSIISNGVQEGDRVVVEGQSRLTPDAPVHIGPVNGGPAPSADGARRGRGSKTGGGHGGRGRGGKRGA